MIADEKIISLAKELKLLLIETWEGFCNLNPSLSTGESFGMMVTASADTYFSTIHAMLDSFPERAKEPFLKIIKEMNDNSMNELIGKYL